MSVAPQAAIDEHELYPVHEEDSLPENPAHELQTRYLRDALAARFPQYWVTGEVCMYWIPENKQRYVAPDVLVVDAPEGHPHDVYLVWSDAPPLLVIEIGSKSSVASDEGPKVERYLQDFHVGSYVYYDLPDRRLRLWRSVGTAITELRPGTNGRMLIPELDLEIGPDDEGFLRLYERDARMLLTYVEQQAAVDKERQRADQERQRAEKESQRAAALEQELERLREELRRHTPSEN